LNDRLAAYIDRVRFLETENRTLSTKIRSYEDTTTRETSNLKALYEQELADARANLDKIAKEKARIEVECNTSKADAAQYKEKYLRAAKDLEAAERKLLAAEGQVGDLQARLNDAVNQRKHWENEFHRVSSERDSLQKQLATALKQLEDESVRNVDLANQVQTLKEELEFRANLHSQELNETRTRSQIEIEEVDSSRQREYDDKFQQTLLQIREENEYQIRITREETEALFTRKLTDLKKLAEERDKLATGSYEELRLARKTADTLSAENTQLKGQLSAAQSRITILEAQLARIHEEHDVMMGSRDNEIRRLREELADQMSEYNELMGIKIQLDAEIAAYRKMLEAEESRLHIESPRRTPLRATPGSSRKRKRVAQYESISGSGSAAALRSMARSGFASKSSSSGPIEVHETDEDGKFIKLFNTSAKELSLGGWQIKHTAGEDETMYKFHRSVHIKPESYVTVWSSDTETTHSPPDDLVMKGQRWFTADNMSSALLDNKGTEMAKREMERSQESHSYSVMYEDDIDSGCEDQTANGENGEKCVIM